MAYKDKDRQREATRERVRRYRAKLKGVTHSSERNAQDVTPATKGQTPGITICQGITKGVLTKEQVQQAYDNLPDRDTSLPMEIDRLPLTKERQVSKQGFNT